MLLAIFAASVAVGPTLAGVSPVAVPAGGAPLLPPRPGSSRGRFQGIAQFRSATSLVKPIATYIDQTRGEDLWEPPTERPSLPVHCCWAFRHPQAYRRNPISESE